jgi:hypothetical protein
MTDGDKWQGGVADILLSLLMQRYTRYVKFFADEDKTIDIDNVCLTFGTSITTGTLKRITTAQLQSGFLRRFVFYNDLYSMPPVDRQPPGFGLLHSLRDIWISLILHADTAFCKNGISGIIKVSKAAQELYNSTTRDLEIWRRSQNAADDLLAQACGMFGNTVYKYACLHHITDKITWRHKPGHKDATPSVCFHSDKSSHPADREMDVRSVKFGIAMAKAHFDCAMYIYKGLQAETESLQGLMDIIEDGARRAALKRQKKGVGQPAANIPWRQLLERKHALRKQSDARVIQALRSLRTAGILHLTGDNVDKQFFDVTKVKVTLLKYK